MNQTNNFALLIATLKNDCSTLGLDTSQKANFRRLQESETDLKDFLLRLADLVVIDNHYPRNAALDILEATREAKERIPRIMESREVIETMVRLAQGIKDARG